MPAKALKAADKQTILKKLVVELKRRYGGSLPKETRPTFETLLFAICLEDSTHENAEAAFSKMLDSFFDLNEIRVSSVSEIEESLGELEDADWKATRIREALQHTFEKFYAFDLEPLRRKTQDVALKELSEIPHQTSFARLYTVQHGLGAHVLPIDRTMHQVLVWLGLTERDSTIDAAGEDLRSAVKKAEGVQICYLLKCAATDAELRPAFEDGPSAKEPPDPFDAAKRLVDLFKNPRKARKPAPAAKPAPVSKSAAPAVKAAAPAKAVSLKRPAKKTTSRSEEKSKSSSRASVTKVTKKRPEPKKTARKRTK
ncbi:hypothetical protein [Planctomicrobium sp. SH664]|uniref:hypothetical protein n=1 Tax=Planctomicrobium sp. SH664 TaxID=3448125 RepID=UPI003F5BE486